jgi:hypothetical protein
MTQQEARPRDDQSQEAGMDLVMATTADSTVSRTADDWFLARHDEIESETYAAYLDGFAAGLAEANKRFGDALDAALAGPHGYGLEAAGVAPSAAEAIRRMLRGMAGVR